jgi:hypothetical protein
VRALLSSLMVERRVGWWGIAFAVLLLIGGGMASIPTSDEASPKIIAFYDSNASVVVIAQVVGVLALVALAAFTLSMARQAADDVARRALIASLVLAVIAELATNIPPLVLARSSPTATSAHNWTLAADLADAALFLALGLLAVAVAFRAIQWLRWFGYVAGVLCFMRAVGSPLGFTGLDAIAPIVVLVFFAAASVLILLNRPLWGVG